MPLEAPTVPALKKRPQGADTVAVFLSANIVLTYWDLWCLLSAKHRFESSLTELQASILDRRLHGRSWSMTRTELLEDLIALIHDLISRIETARTSVDEILQHLPEKLLKKELQKGITNITSDSGSYYLPSEPMLRSPRRLLEAEAMRGMWDHLPVNPNVSADRLKSFFLPPPKLGFVDKGRSFAFARKIDKAVESELKNSTQLGSNSNASRYAVLRAALSLYHELHAWDDSYGVVSDRGVKWLNELLSIKPTDAEADSKVFLKDLLMFLCWENYGLSDLDAISSYVNVLHSSDILIAIHVLKVIHFRATQGFQIQNAKIAERALKKIQPLKLLPVLTLVRPPQASEAEQS